MIINKVCYVCFAFFLVLGTFCDVRSLAKGATRTIYGPYAAKDAAQGTPWRARGGREGRQKLGCQGAMRTRYVQ